MDKQLQTLTEAHRDELYKTNERIDSLSLLVNNFLEEKRRLEMMQKHRAVVAELENRSPILLDYVRDNFDLNGTLRSYVNELNSGSPKAD
jgi:hypothetical protein